MEMQCKHQKNIMELQDKLKTNNQQVVIGFLCCSWWYM